MKNPELPSSVAPSDIPPRPARRSFLWRLGCLALGVAGIEAVWATFSFAKAPVSYGQPMKRNLGDPDGFAPGTAVLVDEARVFVLRDDQGLRAMSSSCTHLGCNVRADGESNGYVCPCHGSRYDDQGHVVGGPAPRSLPFYRLEKDKRGRLVVDLGAPVDATQRLEG
ncbi:MAG: ubiquinol-cytochrome c reductase iron-sulfur subunit [Myxococcota bacterium]